MNGQLYEQALAGERCWIRHGDGTVRSLPVHTWLGGHHGDLRFDQQVLERCCGFTIDLGCGPGRFVADLTSRGVPALGVDLSATAVQIARDSGALALCCDVFGPLPGVGRWQTVLLADGNIGMGGDPRRTLLRARDLLHRDGVCLVEFDPVPRGVQSQWVRLETSDTVGPWFRWATVGFDHAVRLAADVGLAVADMCRIGDRVLASLTLA